jgi:endonuclease-3
MSVTKLEIEKVLKKLSEQFKNPGGMVVGGPYKTLVGVILSARTRDEQVLKLLPNLFKVYPNVEVMAGASVSEIQSMINTIGMYKQKAKNLKKMADTVVKDFNGKIPDNIDDLVLLAGVGRKTASVVLVACFNKPAIAVDTHVHRVTNRMGWVNTKTPLHTEGSLLKLVPKKLHDLINRVFVKFGRYICIPSKPRCWMCPVKQYCRFGDKNTIRPKDADFIESDIIRREEELEVLRKEVL